MIPYLIKRANGIDVIERLISFFAGEKVSFASQPKGVVTCIRFIIPPGNGRLEEVEGLKAAEKLPHIVEVKVYEKIKDFKGLHGDFTDRVGHVIAEHQLLDECQEAVTKALECIKFRIKDGK